MSQQDWPPPSGEPTSGPAPQPPAPGPPYGAPPPYPAPAYPPPVPGAPPPYPSYPPPNQPYGSAPPPPYGSQPPIYGAPPSHGHGGPPPPPPAGHYPPPLPRQPLPYGFVSHPPPPPRPKRSAARALVIIAVMVLALITGLTYGVTKIATMVADLPQTTKPSTSRPPRTPPATKTTPQQTQQAPAPPKPTDTPKAVPPKPTKKWKYNGTGLKDNKIYNINLPGGKGRCDAGVRTPVLSDKATVKYLKELAECTTKALKGPLAVHGFTLTVPKVKGFRKPITTPCGKLGVNGAPAFYCSGDKTIYWVLSSDEGYEAYAQTRLGYVGLFAHEYGHHLQEVTGISNAYAERWWETTKEKDQLLLSRRLELQAQCFEGVYLRYMSKMIKLTSYDKAQIREWHSYTGDEDPPASREPDHGTSEAQIRWLERGLEGANFGTCDTWSVPSKQVK